MNKDVTYRQILRSSSIIGGAAVFNIVAGLIKTKFAAILLGPVGVGLTVLLQNLMQTVVAIAGLSLGSVGTRQIAEATTASNQRQVRVVREALFWAVAFLAVASSVAFLLASPLIASTVAESAGIGGSIGWLAVGIGLSITAQGQTALLTGYRKIGNLAKLSIASVNIAALIGIGAIAIYGSRGILAFVLAPTIVTVIVGQFYVSRLPAVPGAFVALAELKKQWSLMLQLGIALTVAATTVTAGQLVARIMIERELGAGAVGYFQASWLISVTYLGFVLQAMGTDFYPRLTGSMADVTTANAMVNEQTEVALLLAAPVLLFSLGAAPWIVPLLYSRSFDPAVGVLQWQVLGDVLKVASWPLGYLLLAGGASRLYMASEVTGTLVLLVTMKLMLPSLGLEASGLAVVVMYVVYLPCVYIVARVRTGFRWTEVNVKLLAGIGVSAILIFAVSRATPIIGLLLGVVIAGGAGGLCLWRLRNALPGPVAAVVARFIR